MLELGKTNQREERSSREDKNRAHSLTYPEFHTNAELEVRVHRKDPRRAKRGGKIHK